MMPSRHEAIFEVQFEMNECLARADI